MKDKKRLPQESLVRIFINREFFSSLLCTPREVKELVIGWLFNQGLIESVQEIDSLGACDDLRDVHIHLSTSRYLEEGRKQLIKTSGCMGGEIPYGQFFMSMPRLTGGPSVPISMLKSLMRKTLSIASSYSETGGIHCASLASPSDERILVCFEDVGRHNAVDKVVGRMLLAGMNPDDKLLLTSGRISSEMVLKAAHNRISVVASITTGTDLAVRIGEEMGLSLVGRVLSSQPVVWCGEHRIVSDTVPSASTR